MAGNTQINAHSGGDIIAADDITGGAADSVSFHKVIINDGQDQTISQGQWSFARGVKF